MGRSIGNKNAITSACNVAAPTSKINDDRGRNDFAKACLPRIIAWISNADKQSRRFQIPCTKESWSDSMAIPAIAICVVNILSRAAEYNVHAVGKVFGMMKRWEADALIFSHPHRNSGTDDKIAELRQELLKFAIRYELYCRCKTPG